MNNSLQKQFGGRHYKDFTIQPVELFAATRCDCYREGTLDFIETQCVGYPHGCVFLPIFGYATIRDAFADLIDKVSGKGTWMRNPGVWVYEFKLSMRNGNSVFDNQQIIG